MSGGKGYKGFCSEFILLVLVCLIVVEKVVLRDLVGLKGLSIYLRDKVLDGMVG